MIPTAIRDNHELGCACMSVPSDAAIRTPTSKNGASTPLMTAVQNSAFTGAQHLPPIRPSYKRKPYTARYEAVNAMLLNEFLKAQKSRGTASNDHEPKERFRCNNCAATPA
jgi:hypothetical protein